MKTPYFLLLLLPLFSISWSIMEWSLYLAWICVPISVWASVRYSWRGFEMIAIGGLLLPIGLRTDSIIIWSDLGIYLLCLSLSALTAHKQPVNDTIKSFRATPGLCIGILLLPIYLKFESYYGYNIVDNIEIELFPLLFMFMFLLGLARAQIKTLLFLLFIALCFGITIRNEYLYVDFDYHLNAVADYIALVCWYLFGSYFGDLSDNEKSTSSMSKRPRITLLLLLFLWGGVVLWEFIPAVREDNLYQYLRCFIPSGTWYALPLAALYSGINFKIRGVILVSIATIFYEFCYLLPSILWDFLVDSELNILLYLRELFLEETVLIGVAFAIMGKQIYVYSNYQHNNN
jgi:hypothetical protein